MFAVFTASRYTVWTKIVSPQTYDHNSVKSLPILKFFSVEDFLINL